MSERLQIISETAHGCVRTDDVRWLIAEVERLRDLVGYIPVEEDE